MRDRVNTNEKAYEVLKEILRVCNESAGKDPTAPVVSFGPDWGGNALTVYINDDHSHVGYPGCTFEELVGQLHALLIKGVGLSWAYQKKDP